MRGRPPRIRRGVAPRALMMTSQSWCNMTNQNPVPGQITDAVEAMSFIQSGNAHFTLVSKSTGTRYTYHVRESDDGRCFFVSVLYGPDNTGDYVYAGIIRDGEPRTTRGSKITATDKRWRAFVWTYTKLASGHLPDALEIWHEGRCGRCARLLTVPESIRNGIGPECIKKSRKFKCETDGVAAATGAR